MESDFIKSKAKSIPEPYKDECIIEEVCALCDKDIPDGHMVIRNPHSNNFICAICVFKLVEFLGSITWSKDDFTRKR